jgi:thiol-disulfide isomerase/thioredoxin
MSNPTLKKACLILTLLVVLLVGLGVTMFVVNPAPKVPAVSPDDPATATRPYVVKIHARWCPICMLTKGTWTKLQTQFAGRVNLVVLDFTNKETSAASRSEAKRLGLEGFVDAHSGEIGTVYVLDGGSKEVKASVPGARDLAEYVVAVDNSLRPTKN